MRTWRGDGQPVPGRRRAGAVLAGLILLGTLNAGCGASAEPPLARAREAWRDQDYVASAQAYEEYLATNPGGDEEADARFTLAGVYYHNLKEYEQARKHYAAYLEAFPTGAGAYEARERLAEVNVELKNLREAIAQYEMLLVEHPNPPGWRKIRSTIADLYYRLEDYDQADIEYAKVVENASYDELTEQALLRLASIAAKVRSRGEVAVPLYERVIASTSDAAVRRMALKSLSETFADMFRFDEAVATLRRIEEPEEADYVARRIAELEKQRVLHTEAPEVDWSRGKGEGG
ncbi:MAG: tetratricopeptide repeat protein [Acidobacteria bacterium]|nr:tetratricopeptide repeat protein [Acidobacteriota bacterium]